MILAQAVWKGEVKPFLCLIKHHNIKAYGEVEVQLRVLVTSQFGLFTPRVP